MKDMDVLTVMLIRSTLCVRHLKARRQKSAATKRNGAVTILSTSLVVCSLLCTSCMVLSEKIRGIESLDVAAAASCLLRSEVEARSRGIHLMNYVNRPCSGENWCPLLRCQSPSKTFVTVNG